MAEEDFEDFGFNFDYQENLEEMRRIEDEKREFTRSVKYYKDWHLSEDCWSMVLEFLSLLDFYRFSKVCCSFAEILTFNQRCLFFKKLCIDYPNLFDHRVCSGDSSSIATLLFERLSGSGMDNTKMMDEFMLLLFRRGFYMSGMMSYILCHDTEYINDDMFLSFLKDDCIARGLDDFAKIPSILLDNKDFVMRAMKVSKRSPSCYVYISDRLKTDPDIILSAVKKYPLIVRKMALSHFSSETKKEICSLLLKSPKSAFIDQYHIIHCRDVLDWIPSKDYLFDREELFDYFFRIEKSSILGHLGLVVDLGLEIECMQLLFFKRKDYYGTISLISNFINSNNWEYSHSDIFQTKDYPEMVIKPIEKHPRIGKGTFTINQLISDSIEQHIFYMRMILQQDLTEKHFNFFKNYLMKGKELHDLAKEILTGSIRERAIDQGQADAFISEMLSNKEIAKRLIATIPSCFSKLPEDMKKDKDVIEIALRFPPNLEILGKTDENYLKILDKCFREAKRYVIREVGFPNLKKFMTRLYFNVNEYDEPISLKDSVLSFSKLIVPIMKYFLKEYPDIKTKIKKEQLIQMVKSADYTILENLHYLCSETFLTEDEDVRYQFMLKATSFIVSPSELGDELTYELILKNLKLARSPYNDFLVKDDYYYGKLLLTQHPKIIRLLYRCSPYFRGDFLKRLVEEVPEILPHAKKSMNKKYVRF